MVLPDPLATPVRAPGLVALLAVLTVLGGCRGCSNSEGGEVVVYTSVDQVFSEPIFHYCEQTTGLRVRAVFDTEETKSTGVANRLIAEAAQPQADVFWSNDPVRPFLLTRRNLVEPYHSPEAQRVPKAFRAEDGTWTGFAARARVILVNTDKVGKEAMPSSVRDLTDPRWRGKTAIANPLFGTTTMHIAALFDTWGDEKAGAFLQALKDNDVRVASSNGEVKRLVVSGEVAFGLTDTDDAHEAIEGGAHVKVVFPDQGGIGTLVMPTTVVAIRGGPDAEPRGRLIDCLLSAEVEHRMAESAAHAPLGSGVDTPEGVVPVGDLRAMTVDYGHVAETMERIQPKLRQWTGL